MLLIFYVLQYYLPDNDATMTLKLRILWLVFAWPCFSKSLLIRVFVGSQIQRTVNAKKILPRMKLKKTVKQSIE